MKWVRLTLLEAGGIRDNLREVVTTTSDVDYLDLEGDIVLLEQAISNAVEEEIPE